MRGILFNIQRFSIHDGPGIRTTVFLKGCPLRCPWCHNPEGLSPLPQISFNPDKCIGCGGCAVCPGGCHQFDPAHRFSRENCLACGKCAAVCPTGALEVAGKRMTVDEVMERLLRDRPFYEESGGGVTLSGGEPLAQPEFALALAERIRGEKLHLCVETSGGGPREALLALAGLTNLLLFDYKCAFPLYQRIVGYDGEVIRQNLLAADRVTDIRLRCPVIPGVNDNPSHFSSLAETANLLTRCVGIDLQPYHSLGLSKRRRYGMEALYTREELADSALLESCSAFLRGKVSVPVVVQ